MGIPSGSWSRGSGPRPPRVDLRRPGQSLLDVRTEVVAADVALELRLSHEERGLLPGPAEEQRGAARFETVRQLLDRGEPGRVDRGHVAQAKDDDRGERGLWLTDRFELLGRPEEEGTADPEDRHVVRDRAVEEPVGTVVLDLRGRDFLDLGRHRDLPDEEERGKDHPDLDGDREVGEHRQRERDEPDADVGFPETEELRDLAPVAHVGGDHEEDRGERGERDEARERRRREEHEEERRRVDHPGDRRPRARPDVRRGPRDRSRRGEATDQRRRDVRHALRHQLHVGVVAVSRHLVGDEPFAVVLTDDVIDAPRPALRQMIDVFERVNGPVIAVERVPPEDVSSYGIVAIDDTDLGPGVHRIVDLVEKPPREEAPSNLAIIGRYILTPDIFPALQETASDRTGEIQLTNGMQRLLEKRPLYACEISGVRHDTGNKLGFLKATAYFALKRPEFAEPFRRYLETLDKPAGTTR